MVVYLTKNLRSSIKRVLNAYCYEIIPNVYVMSYHAGLYKRILEFIKSKIEGKQYIIVIRKDSKFKEGFSEEYLGMIVSKAVDFEGVKLYKFLKTTN